VIHVEQVSGDAAFTLIDEYYEAVGVMVRDDREVPEQCMWVAYCDGQPAGCVALRTDEVKRMFVRPAFRGRGIARRLLTELETFAAARGAKWLYLDSMDDLVEAIGFYERSGYEPCERYNDNPQATIFMRKAL
jgi:GNAT superfamily N-acetyltransferase